MNPDAVPRCRSVCFNAKKTDMLRRQLSAMENLKDEAAQHKALGHPVRLAIVRLLEQDTCCVCDLANILEMPVSTVSQHLRALATAGLLESNRQGKLVFYSLPKITAVETRPELSAINS